MPSDRQIQRLLTTLTTTGQTTSLPTLKAKLAVKRLRPQSGGPFLNAKLPPKVKIKKANGLVSLFSALWRLLPTHWRQGLWRRNLRPCQAIREPGSALGGHQTIGQCEGWREQMRCASWDHARRWHSISTRTCSSPKRAPHTSLPSPPRPTRPSTHLLRPKALESSRVPLSLTHPLKYTQKPPSHPGAVRSSRHGLEPDLLLGPPPL